MDSVSLAVPHLPTGHPLTAARHTFLVSDARHLDWLPEKSLHLALTSPPYWNLKRYGDQAGQLGNTAEYEVFLDHLDEVWRHAFRALVPGGRLVCVVGDICIARRRNRGRHMVLPLHADVAIRCRRIGFDYLTPIIWQKIANVAHEVENGISFLGKPYEPNGIVKADIEYILMLRKPGGHRRPTGQQRRDSRLTRDEHRRWFRPVWTDVAGAVARDHPAPFPVALAYRLIRMFSFAGDTVLDPFAGSGTVAVAAARAGRFSINIDVVPDYVARARERLAREQVTGAIMSPTPSALSREFGDANDATVAV